MKYLIYAAFTTLSLCMTALCEVCEAPPIAPFSVTDSTALSVLATLLALGLLPTVMALLYISVSRHVSLVILLLLITGTSAATWTHLILHATDERRRNRAIISNGHLYFPGELETLLLENPQKVLLANPAVEQSENEDLKKFLAEHRIELHRR